MFLFEQPSIWFLLLILVVPLLWWRWSLTRNRATIPCSTTSLIARLPRSWIVRTRWIIPTLRTIAIVSLIASISAFVILPFLGSLAGVITGHMSLSQISRTGEQGRGLALAGLIVGYVGLALAVIGVIAVMLFFGVFLTAVSQSTYS